MNEKKQKISKVLQYAATIFLGILTIGAFETSALSGFVMLFSTLIAWPFTRNFGVKLIKQLSKDKIQVDKIKGWMFAVVSVALMIIALMISPSSETNNDSQVAMVEREVQLETEDIQENDEVAIGQEVVEKIEEESEERVDHSALDTEKDEKETLVAESDTKKKEEKEDDPTQGSKITAVSEYDSESELGQKSMPEPESEPTPEPEPISEPEPTPEPTPESEPAPELEPTPEPEEPIVKTPTEPTGSYAVNGKNGKIHIVGDCPATGTGENAMAIPVYFNTYEEAEAYSISIKPSLDKRKCGNCW